MTPAIPAVPRLCSGSLRAVWVYVLLAPLSLSMAAAPIAKHYDLPAGTADKSLKFFSEQTGLEVIFSTKIARAVKTNPVKGEMTARQALDAMLADTGLAIIQDQKTGAFTVSRNDSSRRAAGQEPPGSGSRDSQKKNMTETPQTQEPMQRNRLIARLTAALALLAAPIEAQVAPDTSGTTAPPEETVTLSPFEVRADQDTGYLATSTLAGTRLRSDLKDIPASVSVVTRDFMDDVNATDLESLLVYTLGTEVSGPGGNFSGTADFGGSESDLQAEATPNTRVRGLLRADVTRDFFQTDLPMDGYIVDRVEISRGPNAMLFGLGSPAGIVNSNIIRADMSKTKTKVGLQYGSYGTHRGTLDHNQVLLKDQLAVRLATVYDDTRYRIEEAKVLKKGAFLSGVYSPFRNTVIRTSAEYGRSDSRKPEMRPPWDTYSLWWNTGKPVWDPVTGTGRLLGTPEPGYFSPYNEAGARIQSGINNSIINIVTNGPVPFASNRPVLVYSDPTSVDPGIPGTPYDAIKGFATRAYSNAAGTGLVNGGMAGMQTLQNYFRNVQYVDHPGRLAFNNQQINDSSIFDFYHHMLFGPSKSEWSEWKAYNVVLEQTFLNRKAGIEVVFDRQALDFGHISSGGSYGIHVDINERLPDGTPNPNFGRPFALGNAFTRRHARDREAGRVTGYYDLDLRKVGPSWLGDGIGRHKFNANYMRQEAFAEIRGGMALNNGIDFASAEGRGPGAVSTANRGLFRVHYLGDSLLDAPAPQGTNVGNVQVDQYPWDQQSMTMLYNQLPPASQKTPNPWEARNFQIIKNDRDDVTGTSRNVYMRRTEVDVHSTTAILQSFWLNNSVVTTAGWRRDDVWTYDAGVAGIDPATGVGIDDWDVFFPKEISNVSERSSNFGVVVHAPRFITRRLPMESNFSLIYNESSNFRVAGQRYDIEGRVLGQEIGDTKEYGLRLSSLNNKLELKVVRYETTAGLATVSGFTPAFNEISDMVEHVVAGNASGANADNPQGIAGFEAFLATPAGQTYVNTFNGVFTPHPTPGPDVGSFESLDTDRRTDQIVGTSDLTSKGIEVELVFNPLRNWRIAANVGKAEAIRTTIAPEFQNFAFNVMEPLLRNPDGSPTAVGSLRASTSSTINYADRFRNRINTVLPIFLQEGSPTSELRKWRFNLVTNYDFRIERLKGWGIGGAMRWQDRGVIGFPYTTIEGLNVPDVKNPYYAPETTTFDGWLRYRRKLGPRVNWAMQLNVRNIGVGNELIPIGAQPDGTHSRWRIREAQKWTLSNTFTF